MFDIEEELKKLPAQPGVYLMHDAKDEIIYVGKAISLKNRVNISLQIQNWKLWFWNAISLRSTGPDTILC